MNPLQKTSNLYVMLLIQYGGFLLQMASPNFGPQNVAFFQNQIWHDMSVNSYVV